MDKKLQTIMGKKVYLRSLTVADATEQYCDWLNDPEVNKYLETRGGCKIEELKKYVQERIDDPNTIFLGIFDKEKDIHIGNLKLEPIEWDEKVACFGILIGNKEYWGRGIGTEATRLIVDFAFKNLGLNAIRLGVIAQHKKAIRVYEKVGFEIAKIERKAVNHNGILYNKVIMMIKK